MSASFAFPITRDRMIPSQRRMLSALLSGNFLPFLARLGKRNRDRLLAAFHLASLAAATALGAAPFVPVHLAADFLPEPREYFLFLRFLAIWVLLCRNEDGRRALIGHATKI